MSTVEATTITPAARVRAIGQRRRVLRRLIASDLKVKYEGSTLGYVWSVLEPLMLTAVYFFVFSVIGRFKVPHYPLFLISGILPWTWVTSTVNGATKALTQNAKLITKVYLPREIFPLSVVGAKSIEFLLSLFVLAIFALVSRVPPSIYLLAFPLAVLIQATLLTGIALALSAANTLLRDVERVISPVLRASFYLTPVLYPLSRLLEADIPHVIKVLYRLNPFVGILDLYRAVWYPDEFHSWSNVGIAATGALIIFAFGWTLFARLERDILKEL